MFILAWEGQLMMLNVSKDKVEELLSLFDCRPWMRDTSKFEGDYTTRLGSLISVIPA